METVWNQMKIFRLINSAVIKISKQKSELQIFKCYIHFVQPDLFLETWL